MPLLTIPLARFFYQQLFDIKKEISKNIDTSFLHYTQDFNSIPGRPFIIKFPRIPASNIGIAGANHCRIISTQFKRRYKNGIPSSSNTVSKEIRNPLFCYTSSRNNLFHLIFASKDVMS